MSEVGMRLVDGYDMKSISGRLQYYMQLCSPAHVFTTDTHIEEARKFMQSRVGQESTKANLPPPGEKPQTASEYEAVVNEKQEAKAKFILCGATHPSGDEIIPTPFRMGSWVPMGVVPITALMVTATHHPTNLLRIGLLQWWNQSINASINYYNGAALAGGEDAQTVFLEGYIGACVAAVGIGMGMGRAVSNIPALKGVQRYAPYPAVALANVFNTYLVRKHETQTGIPVKLADGETIGKSKVAAWQGILDTCVSRVIIPAGNFLVSPFLYEQLYSRSSRFALALMRRPWLALPTQVAITIGTYYAILPVSLALYDQEGSIAVSDLESSEPEIAAIAKLRGESALYYHKGT